MAGRRIDEGTQCEKPQGSSRELYATSDIRFVMTEVAKLGERIDGLVNRFVDVKADLSDQAAGLKADGRDTRDKLDRVKEDIDSFKGAIKVFAGLYALALLIFGAFLTCYLRPAPLPSSVLAQQQDLAFRPALIMPEPDSPSPERLSTCAASPAPYGAWPSLDPTSAAWCA